MHSGLQGLGTLFILGPIAAIVDFAVHYHVDWAKIQINQKYGLKPDNSEKYWWLLGADQYAHSVTYIALAAYFLNHR